MNSAVRTIMRQTLSHKSRTKRRWAFTENSHVSRGHCIRSVTLFMLLSATSQRRETDSVREVQNPPYWNSNQEAYSRTDTSHTHTLNNVFLSVTYQPGPSPPCHTRSQEGTLTAPCDCFPACWVTITVLPAVALFQAVPGLHALRRSLAPAETSSGFWACGTEAPPGAERRAPGPVGSATSAHGLENCPMARGVSLQDGTQGPCAGTSGFVHEPTRGIRASSALPWVRTACVSACALLTSRGPLGVYRRVRRHTA